MIKEFDVFLDESGDFRDENKEDMRNSLIGGYIVPHGSIDKNKAYGILKKANRIIGKEERDVKKIHATENISKEDLPLFVFSLLEDLEKIQAKPLIIENKERICIVDYDRTYVNMLCEGIVRLFEKKRTEKDSIIINIVVEMRLSALSNYTEDIIEDAYINRLEENVKMAIIRNGLLNENDWKFTFKIKNKSDPRLIISDVICHSWFTKKYKFIRQDDFKKLNVYFNKGYLFSVIEHGSVKSAEKYMYDGAYGQALISICNGISEIKDLNKKAGDNKKQLQELNHNMSETLKKIVKRISKLPSLTRNHNLAFIVESLDMQVNQTRDLQLAIKLIENILEIFIEIEKALPDMERSSLVLYKVKLYKVLIDAYNHQGNITDAGKYIQIAKSNIPTLLTRFEDIPLFLEVLFRESVFKFNSFDFHGAIELMNVVDKFIVETFELFPAALPDYFPGEIKSVLRGKVYGNRLQAYTFLGRKNPDNYKYARQDSEKAFKEFETYDDLSRQFMYRCQIETDTGEIETAIKYLAKGLGFIDIDKKIELLINEITAILSTPIKHPCIEFGLMHYMRITYKAMEIKFSDLAEYMHKQWQKNNLDHHSKMENKHHPIEVVLWKKGSLHLLKEEINAGIDAHKKALIICKHRENNFTMRAIGLGILIEQIAILMSKNNWHKYKKEMKNTMSVVKNDWFKLLREEDLPQSFVDYIKGWESAIVKAYHYLKSNIEDNDNSEAAKMVKDLKSIVNTVPY